MIRKGILAAALMFAGAILGSIAAPAAEVEPQIYYFGASGCDFCESGLAFLKRYSAEDGRVRHKDFDIVGSADDALVYVRVVNAIGLLEPRVPMAIIGRHVIVGYEDDETTGQEIKLAVEQCRLRSCPDLVHGLMTYGPEVAATKPGDWVVDSRYAKAATQK